MGKVLIYLLSELHKCGCLVLCFHTPYFAAVPPILSKVQDIAGGIITNATSSAKRWYHRAGQGFKQHFGAVAIHLIHIIVVSWLYLELDIAWFLIAGGYLLIAAAVVLLVPQYLQRPTALVLYACGLLISLYLLRQPEALEWFLYST